MHYLDLYKEAVAFATEDTIARWGEEAVPTEPGTEQHTYWLARFDYHMICLKEH